ncbi:MAG TPA: alginate lyase family protein, partial [Blastocatellia bacterium]
LPLNNEMLALMERRFNSQREAILERAERAGRGRFDLLGLSDISFGEPIDWHLEPLSGKRTRLEHWSKIDYLNPDVAGDKKITWELNRHQHFVTLGQAYWLTKDEAFASRFVSQARSWMEANPPGLGINWVSSLEAAFRSISWLWALHLFAGSPQVTPEFSARFLKHLIAHGCHIESNLSYYFSPNTHLTGEALGLFYLGVALPELKRAKRWRELGIGILLEQLPIQVGRDGVYFEQTSYYHRYSTDFYTHLLALARACDIALPPIVEQKLAQMLDHLMWITRPDSTSALLGDDDGGRLIKLGERNLDDFRDTLATGAALFGRDDWKAVAGDAPVELLWLLGPEGLASYDRIEGREPEEITRAFDVSGYHVMRDGWSKDSTCALIDCGPHGSLACGHAHADALAFEFSAQGKTWLVDPGTFTYTGDRQTRDEFRSTEAHNTVTVDGEPQSIPAGPFSWSHIANASVNDFITGDGFDYFDGLHNGYERLADPVKHKRAVLFVKADRTRPATAQLPSYITVRDSVTARSCHSYAIRYHLAPGCSAVADGNRVIVSEPGGARLNIVAFGKTPLRARIDQSWVSRSYASRERALVVTYEVEATGAQDFVTFIIPSAKGKAFHIEEQVEDSIARGFRIISERVTDVVLVGNGRDSIDAELLAATARMAWGRFVNDRFERACFVRGHRLKSVDGFGLNFSSQVRQCAIERVNDRVVISANSRNRFKSALFEPSARVVISGMRFAIERGWQAASFANDGSGWRLENAV